MALKLQILLTTWVAFSVPISETNATLDYGYPGPYGFGASYGVALDDLNFLYGKPFAYNLYWNRPLTAFPQNLGALGYYGYGASVAYNHNFDAFYAMQERNPLHQYSHFVQKPYVGLLHGYGLGHHAPHYSLYSHPFFGYKK